jgi:hypothetical protein
MVSNVGAGAQVVGKASVRSIGGGITKSTFHKRGKQLDADIKAGRRNYHLRVKDFKGGAVVSFMGTGRRPIVAKFKTRKMNCGTMSTRAGGTVTVADIAQLSAIVNSRRGGTVVPFNVPFPMRRFQAPVKNGAFAMVPSLAGWSYGGTDTGYL